LEEEQRLFAPGSAPDDVAYRISAQARPGASSKNDARCRAPLRVRASRRVAAARRAGVWPPPARRPGFAAMADDADAAAPAVTTTPNALDALFAFYDTPEEAVAGVLDTLVGGRFAEEARALAGACAREKPH
jgi:hypothetical protein